MLRLIKFQSEEKKSGISVSKSRRGMELQQLWNGTWLLLGDSVKHRKQLLKMGGLETSNNQWLFPEDTDPMAIMRLNVHCYELPPLRKALLDTNHASEIVADVLFRSNNSKVKFFLIELGAQNVQTSDVLELRGDINKRALEAILNQSGIEWSRFNAFKIRKPLEVWYSYDSERHCFLIDKCHCSKYTCIYCKFACCRHAVPLFKSYAYTTENINAEYRCSIHSPIINANGS